MKMKDKVVISAALTGILANRQQCPFIPYTPTEIAEEALRAYNAGASVVHIHGREYDGSRTLRVEIYKEIKEEVEKRCPIIIGFATGGRGIPKEQRIAHVQALSPPIAALSMGTTNYAKYSEKRKSFVFSFVFTNTFEEIIYYIETMKEAGTKPECECFDLGHLESIFPLIDMGKFKNFQVSLVMGVVGGWSATAKNLSYASTLVPSDAAWQVIGISIDQWLLVATALSLGGHVRVGLEDNFYLSEGVMAEGNAPLVEKAVRMARDIGRETATVEEARAILKLRQL
jgi:uncharacterized protein (DUF849 family)